MIVLCDTNILVRAVQPDDPRFDEVHLAFETLLNEDHELVILFQNIVEFWNVSTRPKDRNGLGFSISETKLHLDTLLRTFTILKDRSDAAEEWMQLVFHHEVKGTQVHDARLAAAMKVRSIHHMLTYNGADFKRYQWITVLTPKEVLQ